MRLPCLVVDYLLTLVGLHNAHAIPPPFSQGSLRPPADLDDQKREMARLPTRYTPTWEVTIPYLKEIPVYFPLSLDQYLWYITLLHSYCFKS